MSLALSACSAGDDRISTEYRSVPVPAGLLASDEARERGREIFREKCALCHGARADGNGVRKEGLSGRPVNFGSKDWRASATPRGIYTIVSNGKRGTSMPAWPTLTDQQKWELVTYVLRVSEDGP
jgi:mono/diheme cytochrome c family protein